jgi:hypothetical protein
VPMMWNQQSRAAVAAASHDPGITAAVDGIPHRLLDHHSSRTSSLVSPLFIGKLCRIRQSFSLIPLPPQASARL